MGYTITPKQYKDNEYGKRVRAGEITVSAHYDAGGSPFSGRHYPVEHVTQDDRTTKWFAHLKGVEKPVEVERLTVEYPHSKPSQAALKTIWGQVMTLLGDSQIHFDDGRLLINYDGSVKITIGAFPDPEKGVVVAHIQNLSQGLNPKAFRCGQWQAHLEQIAASKLADLEEIERVNNDLRARQEAANFAPIDDAALFAEPAEAVQS